MLHISKFTAFIMCFTLLGFSQINNIQFKDMEGAEYDLYELLDAGKHVYIEMIFNT